MEKMFFADIDIPTGENSIEVLDIMKQLSQYFNKASNLNLEVIGQLTQKDAFRIRLKGIYEN